MYLNRTIKTTYMLIQVIKESGVNHLLRKLLANGNWVIGKFEKMDGKWKFLKKATNKSWNEAIATGDGTVENVTDPKKIPENLFPPT